MASHPKNREPADQFILDGGNTSHMTAKYDRLHSKKALQVHIQLADYSKIKTDSNGVRAVKWITKEDPLTVYLTDILVTPNLAMSILSVPVLVNKNVAVPFMPVQALMTLRKTVISSVYAEGLFYSDQNMLLLHQVLPTLKELFQQ